MPSDVEWFGLTNYLGGETLAGHKIKTIGTLEAGTGLWFWPNEEATNSSGFSGLPGGSRVEFPMFFVGDYGNWWSSSEKNSNDAWYRSLSYGVDRSFSVKQSAFSVRCLRD